MALVTTKCSKSGNNVYIHIYMWLTNVAPNVCIRKKANVYRSRRFKRQMLFIVVYVYVSYITVEVN